MQGIRLFGFGSFFGKKPTAKDIDLLLVHSDLSDESIDLAIRCKSLMKARVPGADIVMLSEPEERSFRFIERSDARFLGVITDKNALAHVDSLVAKYIEISPSKFGFDIKRA